MSNPSVSTASIPDSKAQTPATASARKKGAGSKWTPKEQLYTPSRGASRAMKRGIEAIARVNPTKRVTAKQRGAVAYFTLESNRSND